MCNYIPQAKERLAQALGVDPALHQFSDLVAWAAEQVKGYTDLREKQSSDIDTSDISQLFKKYADSHYKAGKLEGLMLSAVMMIELGFVDDDWARDFMKRWGEFYRKQMDLVLGEEDEDE